MAAYIVTYDLLREGENFSGLAKQLKTYGSHLRLRRTVWIVKTEKSASQLANDLSEFLAPEDKLFVAAISHEISCVGYDIDAAEWCRNTVRSAGS